MKDLLALLSVLLLSVGYIPYVRDTIRGKTKPHIFTWFILGTVTGIASVLQIAAGAGVGSLVTVSTALVCFSLVLLCLHQDEKDITYLDTACLILALIAVGVWLLANQPVLSAFILSIASLLGFIPTIRKSWHRPEQETLSTYIITSLRYGLGIGALQSYSLATALYPAVWLGVNVCFCFYLLARRKHAEAKTMVAEVRTL